MIYAIEIDDRALGLAFSGVIASSGPSAVFDGSGKEPTGYPAWDALRRQPTSTSTRHFRELARDYSSRRAASLIAGDLAGRIAANPPPPGFKVWVVSSAQYDARSLGAMLGIVRSLNFSIDGVVDGAVARVASLGIDRTALVLEIGLHHAAVTAVLGGGQVRRRRVVVGSGGGLMDLYQAWIDLISAAMVKRTRFDPLAEGGTEQQVFDALPGIARLATATGSAVARVIVGNDVFETPLTRDQLATAGEPVYREILKMLHELRPAGTPIAVLVPRAALELPGLREALDQFIDCELVSLADGFGALATSMMDLPSAVDDSEHIRLVRRLPSRLIPDLEAHASRQLLGREGTQAPQASHVLFNGKAFSLSRDALVVGRAPSSSHAISLSEGLAGISRRHCTFLRVAGEVVLVDHSTFGTFVNGERVSERVRVHAGDRVRLGEPGVELALIAVGDGAGSVHGTPTQR